MRKPTFSLFIATLIVACSSNPGRRTLGVLHDVPPDLNEVSVDDSLDLAMQSYRHFLDETPEGEMTPEALRRLADLQIEKEFGIIGTGDFIELPAPEMAQLPRSSDDPGAALTFVGGSADLGETEEDFEARATGEFVVESDDAELPALGLPGDAQPIVPAGPVEAIRIYQRILDEYPNYERNDQVLYQMARAYDEIGQPDEAMAIMERLVASYGYSRYLDEVHFRRAEYLFTRRKFREAESAYEAVITMGSGSSYYELALYKLGWALYKQELYELALHRFVGVLDHKMATGYDFDQAHEEGEGRRVADTFRVISLSFSNLGGPKVISEYFAMNGNRSYEDRVYRNLGEFYFSKLRYQDATAVYSAFVELNPYHRISPSFSMRIVEIYDEGGFPILVVESKKDFAVRYGLSADYWDYFDPMEAQEALDFLKTNLTDLANHYHSLYQEDELDEQRVENFVEASRWYREFLASFPTDAEAPGINYQLADLLLENEAFADAAREYERTAYDYAPHERAADAGYAAIYAHRQYLDVVAAGDEHRARRTAIGSSLRFAESFPEHDQAPIVLGAAADDLYAMQDYESAVVAAGLLIDRYPDADLALRRAAWTVVAHGSFDLSRYLQAENAYAHVLTLVPDEDEARPALVENLAAAIYQQGEQANAGEDYRAAADHFLRIRDVAPTSEIRSSAEYDAAAALIRLEDWLPAARVLEEFRVTFPGHELESDATKQLASVYRQGGRPDQSAIEYERVAEEAEDPELRREAMLLAGDLYEQASDIDSALAVFVGYISEFPRPLDVAQETRFRVAELYELRSETVPYLDMLREVVASDASAGAERTDRSRFLAAQSALVLAEQLYDEFVAIRLYQPFDESLAEKQRRMDMAMQAFERLVDYEVGEITAAATFYIAETYLDFSESLLESERPADLPVNALTEYDLAIEEEAFPFEEQAIEIHEQNYELIASGLFNDWIQRSLDRLAGMMPGRYAKNEISSGFIASIDTYAYRAPAFPDVDVGESAASIGTRLPTTSMSVAERKLQVQEVASALVR
jgi:TolA-binding protein